MILLLNRLKIYLKWYSLIKNDIKDNENNNVISSRNSSKSEEKKIV